MFDGSLNVSEVFSESDCLSFIKGLLAFGKSDFKFGKTLLVDEQADRNNGFSRLLNCVFQVSQFFFSQ